MRVKDFGKVRLVDVQLCDMTRVQRMSGNGAANCYCESQLWAGFDNNPHWMAASGKFRSEQLLDIGVSVEL